MVFLLNRQENRTSAQYGERLGPGQVRDVSYYRGSELVTVYALRKTFNLPAFAFPDTQCSGGTGHQDLMVMTTCVTVCLCNRMHPSCGSTIH